MAGGKKKQWNELAPSVQYQLWLKKDPRVPEGFEPSSDAYGQKAKREQTIIIHEDGTIIKRFRISIRGDVMKW